MPSALLDELALPCGKIRKEIRPDQHYDLQKTSRHLSDDRAMKDVATHL